MKKLIFMALAVTLALGIVMVPSVAGEDCALPIEIIKIADGPEEDFTFKAYRDFNNNGFLDPDDVYVGEVVITGSGTGVICVPWKGNYIIREVLIAGSVYEQPPDQVTDPIHYPVTFENRVDGCGEIRILKLDQDGNLITVPGATFEISPNPETCEPPALTVVDEGLNDEALGQIGVLSVSVCQVCCEVIVTETVAPAGYELDPTPQPAHVTEAGQTVTLTFVNTEIPGEGQIKILKVDQDGNLLTTPGATFEITPNPKTCEPLSVLTVVDDGLNDEAPGQTGVLLVSGCQVCCEVTVTETVAPAGYELDPTPQPAHVTEAGQTVTLTFVNTPPELDCGTVCAAQTQPGEFLFSDEQDNWFTWIYYYKGWGTEDKPKTYPIYTGQTIPCGTLYVYDKEVSTGVTHLFVNYVLTNTPTCTLGGLSVYHLQVDKSFDDLYKHVCNKKGNPVPGRCEYKDDFDPMVPSTGWIEADKKNDNIHDFTDRIFIFAHGVGCFYCP